ncbi:MAG: glycosyltransferase, partial [Steroidobacteraceae bacterium]
LMLLQTPRLLLAEIQAILLTRATFVCSEPDRRYLSRFTGSRRLQVVPNSIPFPASVSAEPSEPLVLFVGTMSYEPNALAADMLVKEVWPTVRARVPEARLVIAGTRPELATSYPPKDPSISFAGFVDNLGELYSRARVVCCPITYGAGTRVKIIEAAAHARAIVSTPLGAEGLTLADGSEIVLRESPDLLAQECVRLLQDEVAARQLGLAAREKARCTYDREAVLAQLERLFAAGLGERRSSTVSGSAAQRA